MPLARLVEADSRRRGFGVALGWLVELPIAGAWVARAARAPFGVGSLSSFVTRLHAELLRRARGRLRRSWLFAAGQPVMALTTVGRRSGAPRTTAVACFTDGDDLVVVGLNAGMPHDPAWALNLAAHPHATIEVAGQTIPVAAERATGDHAVRLWQRWSDLQPLSPAFRELAGREIPLFVLKRREQQTTP
jgi:deazaflavin-dependent oxidoreductase (nitroreductase family)